MLALDVPGKGRSHLQLQRCRRHDKIKINTTSLQEVIHLHGDHKMFKKVLLILTLLIILTGTSNAQQTGFGLGLILGEPTGLSGKYWISPRTAIDGAFAWSIDKKSGVHLHSDYLWHDYRIISVIKGKLPIYYGIGARMVFASDNILGVRGVAGINYLFDGTPLDIFLEIVPILDLAPKVGFDFNGAIGIRYYF